MVPPAEDGEADTAVQTGPRFFGPRRAALAPGAADGGAGVAGDSSGGRSARSMGGPCEPGGTAVTAAPPRGRAASPPTARGGTAWAIIGRGTVPVSLAVCGT